MSPFGGLIRYWDRLLPALAEEIPVRILRPRRPLRARLPAVPDARADAAARWVFHSTYLSRSPSPVDGVVLTVHDAILERWTGNFPGLDPDGRITARKRSAIAGADVWIVPSQATATAIRARYRDPQDRIVVVPHGIDRLFSAMPSQAARHDMQRLLAAHDVRRPFLLHVGGRRDYKNFHALTDAYLATSLPERFDVVVAGSEPAPLPDELQAVRQAATRGAKIAFTGYVPPSTLAALYHAAVAYVTATLDEGFGFPATEAAAARTPVVHSGLAVFAETLGGGGTPFDPADPPSLDRAVNAALATPHDDLHRLSESVIARHRWSTCIERTTDAYRRAIESATG